MAWKNPRSSRVPGNWKTIKRRVMYRDNFACQLQGPNCIGVAMEVDHIDREGPTVLPNLRAVCTPCHAAKTQQEAKDGVNRYYARKYRPTEPHPGSI